MGHYGGSLLTYAPIGFVLTAVGAVEIALVGGAVSVAGAMIPDLDQRVPFISHRGPTHTIWFALLLGVVGAAGGALLGSSGSAAGMVTPAIVGGVVGTVTVLGHLLADVLTPMGIRPFEPVSSTTYSLNVVKAANPIANYALLAIGITVAAIAISAGSAIAGVFEL